MGAPTDRVLLALRARGFEPKRAGAGWSCRCPAHDDRNPSLSIASGDDGRALLNCHGGCTADAVCVSIGLRLADLFPDDPSRRNRHARQPERRGAENPQSLDATGSSGACHDRRKTTRIFTTTEEALTELERRYGPPSTVWTYTNEAGDPVGLTFRRDRPGGGKIVRHAWRTSDGLGWVLEGGPKPHPLLYLPDLRKRKPRERVFVCEGEKAVDAARAIGLCATTSAGGAERAKGSDWSPMAGADVVSLPDRDDAGERYAADVSQLVTTAGAKLVRVVRLVDLWPDMPKGGDIVDLIDHFGGEAGAVRSAIDALVDATKSLSDPVVEPDEGSKGDNPGQAEQIVRLAQDLCRFGQTPKHEAFAVLRNGPNVAVSLRGTGGTLRDTLAREYRRRHGKIMGSTAYADALATLRGEALEARTEALAVRVGSYGEGVILDLGTIDGAAVVVDEKGWRIVDRSPIVFQRTALTGALPRPERGGTLTALREVLNVTDASWPLLVGWIVAALIADLPHPILMLGGQQGTGKTSAARYICGLFDPSDAPTRAQPRDPESWAMSVANAWTTVIDNVSNIPEWLSDALCKAVTGDGWVRRTLYTDGDVSVLSFRRVIVLTSIDAGSLRGDLGERLVLVDLEPIQPHQRRTERDLEAAYRSAQPKILGALLDLLSGVLARLNSTNLPVLPRMADFARVLAAVDAVLGTRALDGYTDQATRIADEVIEADPVGEAVLAYMQDRTEWSGAAGELLDATRPEDAGRAWPQHARGMGARLKRLAPALAQRGVKVTPPRPNDRTRTYRLQTTAQTAPPPGSGPSGGPCGQSDPAVDERQQPNTQANRPGENPDADVERWSTGRSGGSGDSAQQAPDEEHPFDVEGVSE